MIMTIVFNALHNLKSVIRLFICSAIITNTLYSSVKTKLIKNENNKTLIKIEIDAMTEADLFPISLIIGLPTKKLPKLTIDYENESKTPFKSIQKSVSETGWTNSQILQNLETATLTISPITKIGSYARDIYIELIYDNEEKQTYRTPRSSEIELLKDRIINWEIAKKWIQKDKDFARKPYSYPSGKWFQFFLYEDGIASISYTTLSNLIENISEMNPKSFSVFMSNELGRSRTLSFNQQMPENLKEISILVTGEDDSSFDLNDKIIFYGRGPSGFDLLNNSLEWNQNLFFTANSCWLFIPENQNLLGKRVESAFQPDNGVLIDYGLVKYHIENDLINLEASGTQWLGNSIPSGSSQPVLMNLNHPRNGGQVKLFARFKGHSINDNSISNHILEILFGGTNGENLGSSINWSGSSVREFSYSSNNLDINDGTNIFYIKNLSEDSNSNPFLDYFELEYSKELKYTDEYEFLLPLQNQDIRLSFQSQSFENLALWDISNPGNAISLQIEDNGFCNYRSTSNYFARLIIFDTSNINEIDNLVLKENQEFNLLRNNNTQSSYVIIGPKQFEASCEELLSIRHPSVFADLKQIYYEFSSGNKDPMALRSFIQWTQENWTPPNPTCFLLLGDSGYDYRNITNQSSIVVPTIQVQSARSYATDDLLSTLYGNIPEVATGRFPARNENEVQDFVEKVVSIESSPDFGPWRQKVTLVADDAARPEPKHGSINTGKSHTLNSEQLATIIPSSIYVEKIYMMEFPEISDESAYGVIKPDATEALLKSLNLGTSILTYIGHGSPYQLAQERLLDLNRGDINQINTGNKLPVWIVGTCSFGHFDDPLTESFAEELIRSKMNAASIVIATSRPITVTGNERYTLDIFESIFENNNVSNSKIGVILQSIKDGSSESQYFHLFGDPALKLPIPKDTLNTISIIPDTLKTLETAVYTGLQDIIQEEGLGYVILNDAKRNVTREYEISSETQSLSYILPGATLFRGQFSFSGHQIYGQLRIPEDISYSDQPASLLIYIHNEQKEARSSISNIYLSGGNSSDDTFGPQIFFEDKFGRRLEFGDHFAQNQELIIRLSDPLGINLTNEPGHEILIENLNSLSNNIATDEFYYDLNSISSGQIKYNSDESEIHLNVKAWDSANNPSEKEIKLFRTEEDKLKILNAYNFPNPFFNSTQFSFEVTQEFDLIIDLFSLAGKRIWTYEEFNLNAGFHTVDWDGLDYYGGQIANGVYLYRLKVMGIESTATFMGSCAKYQ